MDTINLKNKAKRAFTLPGLSDDESGAQFGGSGLTLSAGASMAVPGWYAGVLLSTERAWGKRAHAGEIEITNQDGKRPERLPPIPEKRVAKFVIPLGDEKTRRLEEENAQLRSRLSSLEGRLDAFLARTEASDAAKNELEAKSEHKATKHEPKKS